MSSPEKYKKYEKFTKKKLAVLLQMAIDKIIDLQEEIEELKSQLKTADDESASKGNT